MINNSKNLETLSALAATYNYGKSLIAQVKPNFKQYNCNNEESIYNLKRYIDDDDKNIPQKKCALNQQILKILN